MQANMAGIRRNIVNLAHNYSDAQVKVREATSNDPWGPSSTIMSEIADLTYNVVAFTEIMQMIWKRLNDHGRNWRHVYKALVLLEYLIKTGTEKFQTQWPSSCESDATSRELETARPQTVGEEELQLQLALAMSREEAEQEEQRRRSDDVRLQLALSQSEEEFKNQHHHHKEQQDKRSHMLDLLDVDLESPVHGAEAAGPVQAQHRAGVDPWGFPQPQTLPQPQPQPQPQPLPPLPQSDPWSSPAAAPTASSVSSPTPAADPWAPVPREPTPKPASNDPWRAISPQPPARPPQDPWSPSTNTEHSSPGAMSPSGDFDEFDVITNRERPPPANQLINNANTVNNNGGTLSPDPFDLSTLGDTLSDSKQPSAKKSPHSFLGENSSLVNLDNLVARPASASPSTVPTPAPASANPFSGAVPGQQASAAATAAVARPSINQIRQQPFGAQGTGPHAGTDGAWGGAGIPAAPLRPPVLPTPLLPSGQPNPFLS